MTHIISCVTFLNNNFVWLSFFRSTNSFGAHRCISVKGPFCGFIWLFMIHNGFKCYAAWRMSKLNALVNTYTKYFINIRDIIGTKKKRTCGEFDDLCIGCQAQTQAG